MIASVKPLPKLKKKQWTKNQLQLPKVSLGRIGESLALQFLQNLSYKILDVNVEVNGIEVDLIALDHSANEVVFVEVKTRSAVRYGDPSLAVNYSKIRKMNQVARAYLQEKKLFQNYRLDVIAITGRGENHQIDHFQNISWH